MRLRHIARMLHTVRFLRPVQVTNRLRRRILRPRWHGLGGPRPEMARTAGRVVPWAEHPGRMSGPTTLELFGRSVSLASAKDWNLPELSHLERYNLHYFDDLNGDGANERLVWHRQLIDRWIAENPPGSAPGWDPYPLSLRIVNWIKWHLGGRSLPERALDSLAMQIRGLDQQIEYHLLGNHLLANAKALIFAGVFFAGEESRRWLARGMAIVADQLAEQILADGGHFELSPMYHSIVLEDLLDLLNLARVYPERLGQVVDTCKPLARAMLHWLAVMTHPDGQIALFNDAAFDVAASPAALRAYAQRLSIDVPGQPGDGITALADSGYVRLQSGSAVLLADVARVGPDYLPGHAHADTLSFEWSLGGRRVIVNSGTSCYGSSAERLRQRGTAAHSTLLIDQADSSEVWSGFRVARRARPLDVHWEATPAGLLLSAAHDGYRRIDRRLVHRRRWQLCPGELCVQDQLEGPARHAVARYHLHPDWRGDLDPARPQGELRHAAVRPVRLAAVTPDNRLSKRASTYHPRFGESWPSEVVQVERGNPLGVCFRWDEPADG